MKRMLPFFVLAGAVLVAPRATGDDLVPKPERASPKPKAAPPKIPEIVEMLWSLGPDSGMGPGEGWFHPSQSRYGWKWLAQRHDIGTDEEIARDDFLGPAEFFERLDRDRDGVLTADDFDWSDKSEYAKHGSAVRRWFGQIDRNSNGRISKEEWDRFFAKAAQGKDYLTPDDVREAFPLKPRRDPSQKNEGPSFFTLLKGFATGELGSWHEGPDLNAVGPDFQLRTQDGKREIRLSSFRGKRPVVLIFGSFT